MDFFMVYGLKKGEEFVKMIVGLGNPGPRYRKTRHNFGFLAVEALAKKHEIKLDKKDYSARWGKILMGKETVILARPLTYVNLSGGTVKQLVKKFRLKLKNILVVVDDVNLPWGKVRFRGKGSAGGHNGLKSIIEVLGTGEFPRLRLGVEGGEKRELSNYVLAEFSQKQKRDLPFFIDYIIQTIEVFITDGIEPAMNRFNRIDVLN
ncbi:MAG: aminoacyl-tRNA hydrolase [Candidatus Ratteibacteria bacterium]|nr:aminoacyl-tRNA hydrolase [Candidatus Ratteibacteria bacterium]